MSLVSLSMTLRQCRVCESPGVTYIRSGRTLSVSLCSEHLGEQVARTRPRYGQRSKVRAGYIYIRDDASGQWLPEHRVTMEGVLGRTLRPGESVHHRNGIRDDNRPENLELWVGPIRYGRRAADLTCPHCGKDYLAPDAP